VTTRRPLQEQPLELFDAERLALCCRTQEVAALAARFGIDVSS